MKFGMTLTGVLASLMMVIESAPAAYAAQASSTPTGNDVSYPQCGKKLPSGQAFGIVGVNDGTREYNEPLPDGGNSVGAKFVWYHEPAKGLALCQHRKPRQSRGRRLAGE